MIKKSLFFYIGIIAISSFFVMTLPSPSSALSFNVLNKQEDRMEAQASRESAQQGKQLAQIIKRADNLITDRINSLNRLLTRLESDKKLSSSDKASLTTDVNTIISSLNALKTKIDADTDVPTALADTKSIITTFRIFAIYEPKIRLLITIDNLMTLSTNLSNLSQRVQTFLNTLKSQGKDTTAAQAALADINTQITNINSLLTTDKTLVQNVTVATTDPKSIFTQVRKDLATVRQDFATIRHDFATLREDVHIILSKGIVTGKPGESSESAK